MRERVLLVLEVAFVGLFLSGVALVYVPAALILGGVLGVLAVERATSVAAADTAERKGPRS